MSTRGAIRPWNPIITRAKRGRDPVGAHGTDWPRYITDSRAPFQDQITQVFRLFGKLIWTGKTM